MVVDAIHRVAAIVPAEAKGLLLPDADGQVVRRFVGGVTLNHLGWARLLGLRVALFGKQADDAEGRFLRAGMDRLGIEHEIDLSGGASSRAHVFVAPDGERAIYMARGATAELRIEEIETRHRRLIEDAHLVTSEVSQVPLAVVRRVFELARAAGARTVLDLDVPLRDAVPALGTRTELDAVLACADVIKPSLTATEGLLRATDPEAVAEELARRTGCEAVVITLGADGALVSAQGSLARVPTASIQVVDSTGAGDAFLGGLLAGLRLDLDWAGAARLGNACGACCCEQLGAFPDDPAACRRRVLELWEELGGGALPLAPLAAGAPSAPGGALERFLSTALRELEALTGRVDRATVERAVALVGEAERKGARLHVTGIGKPAHVARYAAALLSSTGTTATFLDATEATHGSVGQLRAGDVLLALSNSGTTAELLACVEAARGMGARVIAVCGDPQAPLARAAEVLLEAHVTEEGGPLGLAPRTSVLAEVLLVGALSCALQERKGLTLAAYHERHPAGALGRRSAPGSG